MSPRPTRRSKAQAQEDATSERLLIYHMQAEMCRTLGHPERLKIIDLLKAGELPTSELLRRMGISKVNLSRHLTSLKQVGLVTARPRGREALYRLSFCEIGSACAGIREILQLRLRQNARLANAFTDSGAVQRSRAKE